MLTLRTRQAIFDECKISFTAVHIRLMFSQIKVTTRQARICPCEALWSARSVLVVFRLLTQESRLNVAQQNGSSGALIASSNGAVNRAP